MKTRKISSANHDPLLDDENYPTPSSSQPTPGSEAWIEDLDHGKPSSQPLDVGFSEDELMQRRSGIELVPNMKKRAFEQETTYPTYNRASILELVDAAVLNIIHGHAGRSGVKLVTESVGARLAEITPALFSPGYRQVGFNIPFDVQERLPISRPWQVAAISYQQ